MTTDVADPRVHAARFLTRLLAEVRALGEGLIVIDQSPEAVAPDVLRLPSTRIAHRTVDQSGRDLLAGSMLLDQYAHDDLARLRPGEAFIYHEGLYRPLLIRAHYPPQGYEPPSDKELLASLAITPWYRKGQEMRLRRLRSSLERLVEMLRNGLRAAVRGMRAAPSQKTRRRFQQRAISASKAAREALRDACATAALDGTIRRTVQGLERIYAGRMASVISAASQYLKGT